MSIGERPASAQQSRSPNAASLPQREYGPRGVKLSIVGFGGILVAGMDQERANRLVAEAFERGVTYLDVAPTYGDAELKLGPALRPYRDRVFLACKTAQRGRAEGMGEFERSLERLETDHFDLYQLHSISDVARDVDTVFARGGLMEALDEAKRQGRVRHLGFSAHSVEAALAAMDRYDFDSVLFPVNFACWNAGGFGPQILERAQQRGLSRLALKAMARRGWPEGHPRRQIYAKCWYEPIDDRELASLALRWTLSQPIAAALPPGEEPLFRMALDIAADFRPLGDAERHRLDQFADELQPIFTGASGQIPA